MRKVLLLFVVFIVLSCSKTNCNEEMARLEELRTQGWHNCNGSKACWDKINSDYTKEVNKLDCD